MARVVAMDTESNGQIPDILSGDISRAGVWVDSGVIRERTVYTSTH